MYMTNFVHFNLDSLSEFCLWVTWNRVRFVTFDWECIHHLIHVEWAIQWRKSPVNRKVNEPCGSRGSVGPVWPQAGGISRCLKAREWNWSGVGMLELREFGKINPGNLCHKHISCQWYWSESLFKGGKMVLPLQWAAKAVSQNKGAGALN